MVIVGEQPSQVSWKAWFEKPSRDPYQTQQHCPRTTPTPAARIHTPTPSHSHTQPHTHTHTHTFSSALSVSCRVCC
jgi:hypothetical protein